MSYENMNEKLKELVAEILEIDSTEIADEVSFKTEYGADSITGLEILAAIEAEFGIHLPESYVEHMTDMNSIYAMMNTLPVSQQQETTP